MDPSWDLVSKTAVIWGQKSRPQWPIPFPPGAAGVATTSPAPPSPKSKAFGVDLRLAIIVGTVVCRSCGHLFFVEASRCSFNNSKRREFNTWIDTNYSKIHQNPIFQQDSTPVFLFFRLGFLCSDPSEAFRWKATDADHNSRNNRIVLPCFTLW